MSKTLIGDKMIKTLEDFYNIKLEKDTRLTNAEVNQLYTEEVRNWVYTQGPYYFLPDNASDEAKHKAELSYKEWHNHSYTPMKED